MENQWYATTWALEKCLQLCISMLFHLCTVVFPEAPLAGGLGTRIVAENIAGLSREQASDLVAQFCRHSQATYT